MKKTVYAYLHTHWDREWYRDKEDFNVRLKCVFDEVLKELSLNNAPFFYFDGQICALIDYLKYNPEKTQLVKELIKKRKLAIGPYFVSADSYMQSFPLMLKNLEIGIKYSKQFYQKDFIGYMSDIFAISKSAFKALSLKNVNKAIICRAVNPKYIKCNSKFKYNDINVCWLNMGYFNDLLHSNNFEGAEKFLDKIFCYTDNNALFPIGADHLGILKNANDVIDDFNKNSKKYKIILTSPFEFFKNSLFSANASCDEFLDNSDTFILSGVYSSRINQKIKNSEIENKLTRIVEPLDFYSGKKYHSFIRQIYETLLKNHAHDSICGCSLDSVAKAVDNRFDKCNLVLDSILKHIIFDFKLKNHIQGNSKDKIGLFNLTNGDNLKIVKIKLPYVLNHSQIINVERGFCDDMLSDTYKIPVTEDICNIYTQLVEVSPNNKFSFNVVKIKSPKKAFSIDDNHLKNGNIALFIKNKKVFIKNLKTDKQFRLKLTDIKDIGDAYNFCPKGERCELNLLKSKVLYNGDIQALLRLYYKNIEIDATIDSYTDLIRFCVNINNKRKNHKLQLCILFDEPVKKTTAQDAVGTISRKHNPDYKIEDYIPAVRPYELKTNSYPMQNFVNCQNVNVLTKGLHEYEIYKNELRICLLRCTGTISNPHNKARSIPAGPDLKIPNAQMQGKNKAELAFAFGSVNKAFSTMDIFMENYVATDGNYSKKINFKTDNFDKDIFFYGISENKKILYNIKEDRTELL